MRADAASMALPRDICVFVVPDDKADLANLGIRREGACGQGVELGIGGVRRATAPVDLDIFGVVAWRIRATATSAIGIHRK
jgi:hypothetical protein